MINKKKRGLPKFMFNKDHEVTGGEENEDQSESFLIFIIINNPVIARFGIGKILIYLLTRSNQDWTSNQPPTHLTADMTKSEIPD